MSEFLNIDQKISIGQKIHDGFLSVNQAAEEHRVHVSTIYDCLKRYRVSAGIPLERRKSKKKTEVVLVEEKPKNLSTDYERLRQDLAKIYEERDRALEEVETLQKIIMTLGRSL